jgi:hypothetical protein
MSMYLNFYYIIIYKYVYNFNAVWWRLCNNLENFNHVPCNITQRQHVDFVWTLICWCNVNWIGFEPLCLKFSSDIVRHLTIICAWSLACTWLYTRESWLVTIEHGIEHAPSTLFNSLLDQDLECWTVFRHYVWKRFKPGSH